MSNDQLKPFRAWIAWHPKGGYHPRIMQPSEFDALQRLCFENCYVQWVENEMFKYQEAVPDKAYADGWRIVEVEIRSIKEA